MLQINFIPENINRELEKAAKEYQVIWESEQTRIHEAFKKVTNLELPNLRINAIVHLSTSEAYPMSFRASWDEYGKKSALIHEVGHRFVYFHTFPNFIGRRTPGYNLEVHKRLNLFLFDVLVELYGKTFAEKNVEHERQFGKDYSAAWDWALAMTPEERKLKFKQLLEESRQKSSTMK